jgi:3-dehydroquinate synthase
VVAVADLPYPITIEPGALDTLPRVLGEITPRNRIVVITDENVGSRYGHRVAGMFDTLPSGQRRVLSVPFDESRKTREMWSMLTDELLSQEYGRDTTLVALGGGVVGDVVGFVAATYMRGIPCVQVPTSLLAMVDASIGGKTGVDTPAGKNLVGAFHPPVAVIIDPALLSTLPKQHVRAGLAEVIKHGVVADAGYFALVSERLRSALVDSPDWEGWTLIIRRSVEIKSGIVSQDERESGLRKVLNFGHTIGHAIEAASEYSVLHGVAVAVGMVIEARIAHRVGLCDASVPDAIERVCAGAGLETRFRGDVDQVLRFTHRDKKARGGHVEYALPVRIGEMAGADRGYGIPVADDIVHEVLTA